MAEVSMAEALQQFLNKSKLKTGVQAMQIEDVWEKIMGKTVAKYTDKLNCRYNFICEHSGGSA